MLLAIQTAGKANYSVLLTANASMIDIGFYVFNNSDRFEIDAGQLGSPLLAGYEWL